MLVIMVSSTMPALSFRKAEYVDWNGSSFDIEDGARDSKNAAAPSPTNLC
jgi:hypothetical protein